MPAWTQADLDAIQAAILQAAKGRTVTFGDRSWTSQDLPELRSLMAEIDRQVRVAPTHRLAAFSKGL